MFCACEITQLLSVVFCAIGTVDEFDFRLSVKETSNKRGQWEEFHAVDEICVLDFKVSLCTQCCILLLDDTPAPEFYIPTFRNNLFLSPTQQRFSLTYVPLASTWDVFALHSFFLYSDTPPHHPPLSDWFRLFTSQTFFI